MWDENEKNELFYFRQKYMPSLNNWQVDMDRMDINKKCKRQNINFKMENILFSLFRIFCVFRGRNNLKISAT
jgi:hypothetical protein